MNNLTTTQQAPTLRRMSQLEYAQAIQQAQGPQARVTWLTVAELIELIEAQQPQAVQIPMMEYVS